MAHLKNNPKLGLSICPAMALPSSIFIQFAFQSTLVIQSLPVVGVMELFLEEI